MHRQPDQLCIYASEITQSEGDMLNGYFCTLWVLRFQFIIQMQKYVNILMFEALWCESNVSGSVFKSKYLLLLWSAWRLSGWLRHTSMWYWHNVLGPHLCCTDNCGMWPALAHVVRRKRNTTGRDGRLWSYLLTLTVDSSLTSEHVK